MKKFSFVKFKQLIKDGNYLIDYSADHILKPILFNTKRDLKNWLDQADQEAFYADSLSFDDCKRLPFEVFNDNAVIMSSDMGAIDFYYSRYSICLFIELYSDYLRLDNFTFDFSQIATNELDGILNEDSDG